MRLIVGLGNSGLKYIKTLHNTGFVFMDALLRSQGLSFNFSRDLRAYISKGIFGGSMTIFAKPDSFMNTSGTVVKNVKNYYKIETQEIIVVHDDIDIEIGDFKIVFARNAGGHLGVESVIENLKTNAFSRLRIGVKTVDLKDIKDIETQEQRHENVSRFVLRDFSASETEILHKTIDRSIVALKEKLLS